MWKYTVAGLEEREAREAAAGGDAEEAPGPSSANPAECQYYLKGIVVHSGTAFAGHYYSYIKVRPHASPLPMEPSGLHLGMVAALLSIKRQACHCTHA